MIWSETSFVPAIEWHTRYRTDARTYELVKKLKDYMAAQKVRSGWEDLVVAGGVESMSRVPLGTERREEPTCASGTTWDGTQCVAVKAGAACAAPRQPGAGQARQPVQHLLFFPRQYGRGWQHGRGGVHRWLPGPGRRVGAVEVGLEEHFIAPQRIYAEQFHGAARRVVFCSGKVYYELAARYAALFNPQRLLIMCGMTGTGKSTLARRLAEGPTRALGVAKTLMNQAADADRKSHDSACQQSDGALAFGRRGRRPGRAGR